MYTHGAPGRDRLLKLQPEGDYVPFSGNRTYTSRCISLVLGKQHDAHTFDIYSTFSQSWVQAISIELYRKPFSSVSY